MDFFGRKSAARVATLEAEIETVKRAAADAKRQMWDDSKALTAAKDEAVKRTFKAEDLIRELISKPIPSAELKARCRAFLAGGSV